ncbi:MAG: cache domain-containing protein, partial [Cyanobacteriota bacterium]
MLILTLHRLVAKVLPKIPLRSVFVVPFILQIFAAVGLTGYLSFKNGEKAVHEVASQLQNEISDRIKQNLQAYLATPHQINQHNLDAVKLGLLNMQNLQPWEKYLWQQVQVYPYIFFMGVSTNQGLYRSGQKLANGSLRMNVVDQSTGMNFYSYETNEKGGRTTISAAEKNIDTRKHTAYKDAVQAGKPTWSSVYTSWVEPTLILSAVRPVHDQDGQVVGILNTALRLDYIGQFLNSLKIGKSGQAFIIERNGTLLATSTSEKPFRTINNQRQLFKAIESSDPLTQATANYLTTHFGGFPKIQSLQQLDIEIVGKRQFLQVVPFQDTQGLDWRIVVVVPEADFMEQIHHNTRITIFLCIVAFLMAT